MLIMYCVSYTIVKTPLSFIFYVENLVPEVLSVYCAVYVEVKFEWVRNWSGDLSFNSFTVCL